MDQFTQFANLGVIGILFYMWWKENEKSRVLQAVIKEQVEDKKLMREERTELMSLLKEHAALLAQVKERLS